MSPCTKPLPRAADVGNAPYWVAAREGKLKVQQCDACGRLRFPAASICPACRAGGVHWQTISGYGVVESFCRFHKAYWPGFADELPYTVLQVKLDEGVRVYSNPEREAEGRARIGMRVRAVFVPVTPDVTLVKFREAVAPSRPQAPEAP